MRAVNDHFVANPIEFGHFFPGENLGHPLAGGLIAPLLDAGGFRHRSSAYGGGKPSSRPRRRLALVSRRCPAHHVPAP